MSINDESVLADVKRCWAYLLDNISPKRKLLRQLRERWGVRGDKDGFLESRYFDLAEETSSGTWVDEKTWRDLEFQEIFHCFDITVTPIGSQVLFARLRKYMDDAAILAQRYSTYKLIADDQALREALQLRLSKLGDDSNADLADILFGERRENPQNHGFIWACCLLSLVSLALVAFFKVSLWVWLAVVVVNVCVIFRQAPRTYRESEAINHCGVLLNVADDLAASHSTYPSLMQLARLHEEIPQRVAVRTALFWFGISKTPPFSIVFSILNVAFLIELIINARAIERFFRMRSKLSATYEMVGEIDAYIALASCLQQYPRHCLPAFVEARTLSIVDGCHPLLPDGVANSIELDQHSALVTGSNMAGKTTFIKMLACNAILAQTVGFSLASAATIPQSTVMASIHGAHSVKSGKSHYFAEVETIDRFIRDGVRGGIKILVIDEPFNGTNTVERIAVAWAVLESLGKHAIVLTTTHDVELQDLLGDGYKLYHFEENPDVDGYFDYALKLGPVTARNAIRLLDRMGFPAEIVANAMSYVGRDTLSNPTKPHIRGSG